ncbi:Putative zinc transporter At3g08650 [Linum perenne]
MSPPIRVIILVLSFFLLAAPSVSSSQDHLSTATATTTTTLPSAPHKNVRSSIIDGTVTSTHEVDFDSSSTNHNNRVSISTVALFTLAMAAATGLGALPFFFIELDPQWAGLCNGMAAGVMLAASFDLIQEGQAHGAGSWVMIGILSGGLFILLCKKFLEQYGEVSMLDIKGADATKVVLVIGIMTLHSFGEGSGVGVSFAGSKGFSQGLLVTLAIAVHNIPEGLAVSMVLASRGVSPQNAMLWSVITSLPQPIVAVPSFICADAFNKFLPFCTGFAAGCMIWMVVAEVLPDAFKLLASSKMGFIPLTFLLTTGAAFVHGLGSIILGGLGNRKKLSANNLPSSITGFPMSVHTLQSFLSCGAIGLHALAEGLALGVAAPKAYGLGRHMVLPVSLHGLPRGAAVASCILGATDSWQSGLAAAALIGFVGPMSAIGSILAGIDYSGLDHVMVFACGGLVPSFGRIIMRAVRLDSKKTGVGLAAGVGFAIVCLTCTKLVCLHTPYCNSAPEAVR